MVERNLDREINDICNAKSQDDENLKKSTQILRPWLLKGSNQAIQEQLKC